MSYRGYPYFLLIAVLAAGAGYWARGLRDDSPRRLLAHQTAPLEAFVSDQSFSEVETAKATLKALCTRYRLESQQERSLILQAARSSSVQASPSYAPTVPLLRRGIAEFQETGQELVLIQDLLLVLSHDGRVREWLDLYLDTLYRHPTADLAGQFAPTAVRFGRTLGRSTEVAEALQHVALIPLEFAAKPQVENARTEILLVSYPSGLPAAPHPGWNHVTREVGHP